MNALARLLAEIDDSDDTSTVKGNGLPEAQIARLQEAATRIADGNQFKVGDLVTVRNDAPVKGHGKPHLVIEINADAPLYNGEPGNWPFAARFDVVVISVVSDDIATHAIPHWMLETYAA
jgi:hypothetical protein